MIPSSSQLRKAASILEQIEKLEAQYAAIFSGSDVSPAKRKYTKRKKARRKMSPEAKAKIAAAQKKRWANQRKAAKSAK